MPGSYPRDEYEYVDEDDPEMQRTTITLVLDHWEELDSMVPNRAETVRRLISNYIDTGEMDESVKRTRESILRTHLEAIRKERMQLESKEAELADELTDEKEEEAAVFKIDLGRL